MTSGEKIKKILSVAKEEKRSYVLEHEVKEMLKEYNLDVTKEKVCKNVEEALGAAKTVGYPLVLKVVSPDVVHKSDSGGVKVGIKDDDALKEAFAEMLTAYNSQFPPESLKGISVQEMVQGEEVIIGAVNDPQFGQMLMVGMGGVFVEIFKDVAYRLAPIDKREAEEMLKELKGYKLLTGYRGKAPVNIEALCQALVDVSRALSELPEIKEMDLNPILVSDKRAVVADGRIFI